MNYRVFLICVLFLVHLSVQAETNVLHPTDPKTQRMFEYKIKEAAAAFDKTDYGTTRKKIEEADGLIPNDPATINLRGALLYKEKKYEEALVVFQDLISRDTNSYPGYFNTAEVLLAQGKYDEALDAFQRIVDARPGDEVSLFRIVIVLSLQKKFDEARARARKIPKMGQSAAYYFAHAAIELAAGQQEKGLGWIKQSEILFPAESSKALRDALVEHQFLKK